MSTPSMDSIIRAMKNTLTPGGTPVGTLSAVFTRHQDMPYRGRVPALLIPPFGGPALRQRIAAKAKGWQGDLVMIYHDATPVQQSLSLTAVEDALVANVEAIVDAIEADPTLGGAVAFCGDQLTVQPHPDGFLQEDTGTAWISFLLTCPFRGLKQSGV